MRRNTLQSCDIKTEQTARTQWTEQDGGQEAVEQCEDDKMSYREGHTNGTTVARIHASL